MAEGAFQGTDTGCVPSLMKPAKTCRNSQIDALRGAAILLVVFGHMIEKPSSNSEILQAVYIGIYSFHMPLFVFLSGLFARDRLEGRDYRKIVWTLIAPLAVFQLAYIGAGRLAGWYDYSLFTPYWLLWFIASMVVWRLVLPLFASPAGLAAAVAVAVAAGYDDGIGYALSLSRTLYFLPFFVLGHLYGAQLVTVAPRHPVSFALVFAGCVGAVLAWWQLGLNPGALTGSRAYASGAADANYPAIARLGLMTLGGTAAVGFAALVPARATMLGWFGERSLAIYLLHGLVVMAFVASGAPALIPQVLLLPVLATLSVLVALATAPADGPMRRLFSPPRAPGPMASA